MNIRPRWLRDFSSVIFTVYYLICAEQADDKVRKVRGGLTLQHLRISWNKPTTPYIKFFTSLTRPALIKHKQEPREIRIPRPKQSSYDDPVHAWLYFDGPLSELKKHDKLVLDIPGGGFVAMDPRCHDDKLFAWSKRIGLPVLALDYRKAPEYPYPYALNECYDVYHALMASKGQCVGLSGERKPKIVVSGDSAGGNMAVGLVLMILQSGSTDWRRRHGETSLPLPDAVVLVYPALDMNIGNWMTDEQMALIRDRRARKLNEGVLQRKSDDYRKLTPNTPLGSDDEDDEDEEAHKFKWPSPREEQQKMTDAPTTSFPADIHTSAGHTVDTTATTPKPSLLRTRLAMSSMISYFNDRILTPEMMRAMIVLYIGPHSRPDFSTDFLLSPLLAPEVLLARFPKTFIMTGERDPLVDDTVIFAGRLRQAKRGVWQERKELGLIGEHEVFDERAVVDVALIPGISHGFLQFVSVFPAGWRYVLRAARWISEGFAEAERRDMRARARQSMRGSGRRVTNKHTDIDDASLADDVDTDTNEGLNIAVEAEKSRSLIRGRSRANSSGDEDRPLEMTMAPMRKTSLAVGSTAANNSGSTKIGGSPRPRPPRINIDRHSPALQDFESPAVNSGYPLDYELATPGELEFGPSAGQRMTDRDLSNSAHRNGGDGNGNSGHRGLARARGGTGRDEEMGGEAKRGPGKGSLERSKNNKSLVSLGSADDLLGRRMKGLTGGLMGFETGLRTP